jgi:hypothetical protein
MTASEFFGFDCVCYSTHQTSQSGDKAALYLEGKWVRDVFSGKAVACATIAKRHGFQVVEVPANMGQE